MQKGSPFSTPSLALTVCRILVKAILIGMKWYLITVSHLHFSNDKWCWASFHVYWPSLCLLWRNVCLGLLHIFWLGCLFFWYWAVWVAYIFWRLILCGLFHLQLFLQFYFFIFGCVESSLLYRLFLQFAARASHCSGFSCCTAQALGRESHSIAAHRLRSCSSRALEHRLRSYGAWA